MTGIKGTLSNYQFTGDFHVETEHPEMHDASTMIDSGDEGYSLGTTIIAALSWAGTSHTARRL